MLTEADEEIKLLICPPVDDLSHVTVILDRSKNEPLGLRIREYKGQ